MMGDGGPGSDGFFPTSGPSFRRTNEHLVFRRWHLSHALEDDRTQVTPALWQVTHLNGHQYV